MGLASQKLAPLGVNAGLVAIGLSYASAKVIGGQDADRQHTINRVCAGYF